MSETTHIRIYESDKDRIDDMKDDLNTPSLIRDALNALERERDTE